LSDNLKELREGVSNPGLKNFIEKTADAFCDLQVAAEVPAAEFFKLNLVLQSIIRAVERSGPSYPTLVDEFMVLANKAAGLDEMYPRKIEYQNAEELQEIYEHTFAIGALCEKLKKSKLA
jgi:hypothetical protein